MSRVICLFWYTTCPRSQLECKMISYCVEPSVIWRNLVFVRGVPLKSSLEKYNVMHRFSLTIHLSKSSKGKIPLDLSLTNYLKLLQIFGIDKYMNTYIVTPVAEFYKWRKFTMSWLHFEVHIYSHPSFPHHPRPYMWANVCSSYQVSLYALRRVD